MTTHQDSEITIDGVVYWQPECKCKGTGHICYLRPLPTVVNIPIEKILQATAIARGSRIYPTYRSKLLSEKQK